MRGPLRKAAHDLGFFRRGTTMPAPSEKSGRAVLGGSFLIAAAIGGFVLGGLCAFFYLRDYHNVTPPPTGAETSPTSAQPDKIVALGRIEPRDGILFLGVPAPDRITKIRVKEGDRVNSGKQLVELESEILRQLEEELSEIQRQGAKKRLEAVKASGKAQIQVEQVRLSQVEQLGRPEIEAQESKIAFLRIQAANAEKDFQRLEKAGDTIAEQDKEKQNLLKQQAQEELAAALKQYQKLLAAQPLDLELAKARLVAARAELERGESSISLAQLDNQTAQAKARRKAAQITAPSNGTILRLLAHEGELVQGKPIVQMANLDKMIVVAEVPISFIPRVRVKDKATVTSRVFEELGHKELGGEVYSIGEIVGKPQVTSLDPLASVDYRIVEVKILLDRSEPAAKYIGHEVNVTIKSEPRP
jgi:HlyD family secretion protein